MRKHTRYILLLAASAVMASCSEHYITYDDAEYIMFADSVATYAVREDIPSFSVPVVSTIKCDCDRTFAVEVLSGGSAVEGRDFVVDSYTFTIPAGQNRADIKISGVYDRLEYDKPVSFSMRLLVPDELKMPFYSDCQTVTIDKKAKYDKSYYCGYAMVTSLFLYEFNQTGEYQRLIFTQVNKNDPNTVILRNYLFDGYDVKIHFDDSDPLNPTVTMDEGQAISDEASVFGIIYGDNRIYTMSSPLYMSYFMAHRKAVELVDRVYVETLGNPIGMVGDFMNVVEWVSDEEAERLQIEDGLTVIKYLDAEGNPILEYED